jgi:hypothetical protein
MTRETKAGLVVSCSFLCLVGAVVAVKLRQQPADGEQVARATREPDAKKEAPSAQVSSIPSPLDKEPGNLPTLPPAPAGVPTEHDPGARRHTEAEGGGKHASANPATAEQVPPPPGAVPQAPPAPERTSTPSSEIVPPPLPPGAPLLPPPSASPEVKPEGPDVPSKDKANEKSLAKDEPGNEKHDHKGKSAADDKAKPTDSGKDKLPAVEPVPAPSGVSPVSPVPPSAEATPPADGHKPHAATADNSADHAHGKADARHEDAKEMPPPLVPGAAPPPIGAGSKPVDPALPPVAGAPTRVGEPPASMLPPAVSPGGTPLPPIGGVTPAEDKPFRPSAPPVVGKPELLTPEPAPIPAPPPAGSSQSMPLHSDFIPKAPPPVTDPQAAAPPTASGEANRARVILEPIRPMPVTVAPAPEGGATGGATNPNPTLAPIGAPAPLQVASTAQPPIAAPVPIPAPVPQTPLGMPITATTPPIRLPDSLPTRPLSSVPAATPVALTTQVVSYEEIRHSVRTGDTFASLSTEYYNTDGYAKALLLWNQTHPRASDAMARDGTLVPGDKVFIPPVGQLEQHCSAAISTVKPAPRPAGAIQTGFTTPAAADFAYYKVVEEESVEVIARRTFGTGDRANDLLRLNPNLRSGQTVPAGTMLLLPAGARVPAENVPH